MSFRARTLLLVTILLAVAVMATSAALTWTSTAALLGQTQSDAVLIAHLLARSVEFADDIVDDVDEMVGGQMIVEATLAAQLVALGEAHGASTEEIAARLREVTRRTALDEIWITDEAGHAYVHSVPNVDFTFSPDPAQQPQASAFWPLLDGSRTRVVQKAQRREIDAQDFKYVAVAGVDRPRIVQVGYNGQFLERLRDQVGLARLIQDLVAGGNVAALQVVDRNLVTLAYSAVPGLEAGDALSAADTASIDRAIDSGETSSRLEGDVLTVIAPIVNPTTGARVGAAIVDLSTRRIFDTLRRNLEAAALLAVIVLCLGVAASTILARRVTQPVAQLTAAAAAIEAGASVPSTLGDVTRRRDELGQLARVFERMAREVYAREERLQQQVQALRIEIDQAKRARQVAEITETDYFQQLQQRARALRARPSDSSP
jgi:hypothetical protein